MMINGIKNRKKDVKNFLHDYYEDFIFVSLVGLIPFYFSRLFLNIDDDQ